jgi:hypothetical protein
MRVDADACASTDLVHAVDALRQVDLPHSSRRALCASGGVCARAAGARAAGTTIPEAHTHTQTHTHTNPHTHTGARAAGTTSLQLWY